jgi:hypothetical protein
VQPLVLGRLGIVLLATKHRIMGSRTSIARSARV